MARTGKTYAGFTGAILAFGLAMAAANAGDGPEPGFARKAAGAGTIQIAERRQLSAGEVGKRLVGRALRREAQSPRGKRARYLLVRPDGSFFYKCEWYNERGYAWVLCRGLNKRNLRNGFTNGIWSIKGNLICLRASTIKSEGCYAVHEDGARIFFKLDGKGLGILNGYYEFLDETRLECVGYLKSGNC